MALNDSFYVKQTVFENKLELFNVLSKGAIFVYPTDTIYGLGCDATIKSAVENVKTAKNRQGMAFSVIAPSKQWILDHCEVSGSGFVWLEKLPGPYTLIFKLNQKGLEVISPEVNKEFPGTLGVRIPNHWISEFVCEYGNPIVTTSANISGQEVVSDPAKLVSDMLDKVGFVASDGILTGTPSTIINLTTDKEVIIKR
ncbi:threonylcarbamoyl-AMP synthase [Candidatus Woesearchaeota archaeon]|jgi:tRNA threonylcarbamoyl adenosine modification protein (Sua5/YciO/YrdC/YwlC family)|nr:threonylcarbamoyl-AMP synthase [Candidatus Woesearchaeota archaeon]